ncbi:MAG: hypothetical protein ABSC94_24965 [Polyangiaceae bacterium]
MKTLDSAVRAAIARRRPSRVSAKSPPPELGDDVELTPLEIVLAAIEVERHTLRTWSLDELAGIRTLGELVAFFESDGRSQSVRRAAMFDPALVETLK